MDFKIKGGMPMGGMPQLPSNAPMFLLVPGAAFVLLGVWLLISPKLLVYLVAGILFPIGGLLLLAGLRAKRMLG